MNQFDSRQVGSILTRLAARFMRVWIVALATLFLSAAAARADVTYCYTGKDFTSATPPTTIGEATSDYVTGCVTLSEAITATTPTDYKTDVDSISFGDSEGLMPPLTSTSQILNVVFDESGGVIQDWAVDLQNQSNGNLLETNNYTVTADFIQIDVSPGGGGGNGNDPGNWGEVSPTPEPASAILWLTGIVLMILKRKRIAHLLRLDSEVTLSGGFL